jgi:TatD DNase family protein
MYVAVGVHPHDVVRMTDETLDLLRAFARRSLVKAIGEIGLDYYHEHSPQDIQRVRFAQLLDLALELKLPVSIHSRDAFEDTVKAVASRDIFQTVGGVMHCFTGSAAEAKTFLDLGAYISFSGIATFKRASNVHEAIRVVPMERLLIETDAPFLSPEPHRGKRNEPSMVRRVAEVVADLKGTTTEEIARKTSENAARLFRWA